VEHSRDRRQGLALVVLCLAQFMVILDITVVNVALPVIGNQLALDRAALTWVVTAYTLCFGGLLLLGGRLADTLGRRRTFLAGLGLFTLASLGVWAAIGAAARRSVSCWAARWSGAQAGSGCSSPTSRSAWPSPSPPRWSSGPAGPMAPLAGWTSRGALAVTGAVALLIFGLVNAGDAGWSTAPTLTPLAASLAPLGGSTRIEPAVRSPLVRLQARTRRPVVAGMPTMLAASALLLSAFSLSPLYLQRALGFSALGTGLSFLPIALAIILGAQTSAHTLARLGPRPITAAGFALAATGTGLLARPPANGHVLVDVLPGFTLATIGLGPPSWPRPPPQWATPNRTRRAGPRD
jgi:MFS family permease